MAYTDKDENNIFPDDIPPADQIDVASYIGSTCTHFKQIADLAERLKVWNGIKGILSVFNGRIDTLPHPTINVDAAFDALTTALGLLNPAIAVKVAILLEQFLECKMFQIRVEGE